MKVWICVCPSKCSDTSAKCFLKSKCPGTRDVLRACAGSSLLPHVHSACSSSSLLRKTMIIMVQIPLCLLWFMCLLKDNCILWLVTSKLLRSSQFERFTKQKTWGNSRESFGRRVWRWWINVWETWNLFTLKSFFQSTVFQESVLSTWWRTAEWCFHYITLKRTF